MCPPLSHAHTFSLQYCYLMKRLSLLLAVATHAAASVVLTSTAKPEAPPVTRPKPRGRYDIGEFPERDKDSPFAVNSTGSFDSESLSDSDVDLVQPAELIVQRNCDNPVRSNTSGRGIAGLVARMRSAFTRAIKSMDGEHYRRSVKYGPTFPLFGTVADASEYASTE